MSLGFKLFNFAVNFEFLTRELVRNCSLLPPVDFWGIPSGLSGFGMGWVQKWKVETWAMSRKKQLSKSRALEKIWKNATTCLTTKWQFFGPFPGSESGSSFSASVLLSVWRLWATWRRRQKAAARCWRWCRSIWRPKCPSQPYKLPSFLKVVSEYSWVQVYAIHPLMIGPNLHLCGVVNSGSVLRNIKKNSQKKESCCFWRSSSNTFCFWRSWSFCCIAAHCWRPKANRTTSWMLWPPWQPWLLFAPQRAVGFSGGACL